MAHEWRIAQREYDRQLSRRGKLHALETLIPAASPLEANPYCRAIIPTISALAGAVREGGGTLTNVCCESSARDAYTSGFRVIMAADANAARTDAELHTIYRTFGDVRPTAEILALIAAD